MKKDFEFSIRTLNSSRNDIEDRISEIEEGGFNHHPGFQVKHLREQLIVKSTELSHAIDLLKNFN